MFNDHHHDENNSENHINADKYEINDDMTAKDNGKMNSDFNNVKGMDEGMKQADQHADVDESNKDSHENHIQQLEVEITSLKDQLLRALAEVENIRRRADRERLEASQYAITKFARDILSINDNLARALETIPNELTLQNDSLTKFIEGVRLTERELNNTFERHHLKKISPLGEVFDHNFHQAIMEIPTTDHVAGTVVQVLQTGYSIQDRLLRPAMVSVAKAVE